jgi:NAD(P)-dependent dehydrogenase (short-subunit alcohol dehydrogenase family)
MVPRDVAGKVVVITGGGRGIGTALVRSGAKVVLGDLDVEVAKRRRTGWRTTRWRCRWM